MQTRSAKYTRLFVYGTLKRGGRRSGALSAQQFVGRACTLPEYRIYDCGDYPGLVPHQSGVSVEGEIWDVDAQCLALLDELEGMAEGLYERRNINLAAPFCGQNVQSYFYCHDVTGLEDCGTSWQTNT